MTMTTEDEIKALRDFSAQETAKCEKLTDQNIHLMHEIQTLREQLGLAKNEIAALKLSLEAK